jgi:hypothetical protein
MISKIPSVNLPCYHRLQNRWSRYISDARARKFGDSLNEEFLQIFFVLDVLAGLVLDGRLQVERAALGRQEGRLGVGQAAGVGPERSRFLVDSAWIRDRGCCRWASFTAIVQIRLDQKPVNWFELFRFFLLITNETFCNTWKKDSTFS